MLHYDNIYSMKRFKKKTIALVFASVIAMTSAFGAEGYKNTLKALSDPIRREILNLLKNGKMSAGEIVDKFPVPGASISRHLSVLKEADLIRDTREGKFIYYELNASVLEEIMLWITDLRGDSKNEEV